mgnify:CR=1 FL=1
MWWFGIFSCQGVSQWCVGALESYKVLTTISTKNFDASVSAAKSKPKLGCCNWHQKGPHSTRCSNPSIKQKHENNVHSAEARTGSLLFSTLGKNEDENDSFKKMTRRMTMTTGAKMDKIWLKHSILDKQNSNTINSQFFKCVCFIWISIHFHGNFLYPTTSGSLAWFPFNFCPQPRFNLCIPGLSSISCIFFYLDYLGLAIFFSTRGCVGYACT